MAATLRRKEIVRRRRDIRRIRRTGRHVSGSTLFLRHSPQAESVDAGQSTLPERRVAVLLTRGIKGAVRRNRLKRRLREVYRLHKDWFPPGRDYLLSAAPAAADLGYATLEHLTERLTRRLPDAQRNN